MNGFNWRGMAGAGILAFVGVFAGPMAPAQAAVPKDYFGVVPQLTLAPGDFDRMAAGKVGTLRIGINWPALQRSSAASGRIRTIYDEEIGRAASKGIEVLPFVNNTPEWVRPDEDLPPIETEADRMAFKNFMRLLVKRYGPNGEYWTTGFEEDFPRAEPLPIKTWQIWNEPSSPASWEPFPNAKEYGTLVLLASAAIHEVDPAAKVMLAGNYFDPLNNASEAPVYTKKLLEVNGVRSAIDSVALHPYASNFRKVASQIKAVRETMVQNGAGDKQLFITEVGWSTGNKQGAQFKSPEDQAALLKKVFRFALSQRLKWNLRGVYWYSLVDLPPGVQTCFFCAGTGLFKANRQPKPSWGAFKSFTQR